MGELIVDNVRIRYTTLEVIYASWIPVEIYLPQPFDIVEIHTSCKKKLTAWFTGRGWDGYKLKPSHVITGWRRIKTREEK